MELSRRVRWLKIGVWVLGLYPLARLAWAVARHGVFGGLGAEPVQRVLDHTGWWALTLLTATLAVTPLRRITGRNELIRLRRPLGLFAFFYASLHFATYLGLDMVFEWVYILEDIAERPFITVGFAAWLVLLALAATSSRRAVRRLGRRWTALHRLVYLAAGLGILHFYWRVKADTREPLLFAAVILALLAARAAWWWRARRRPGQAVRRAT